jgi:hypothetical protein
VPGAGVAEKQDTTLLNILLSYWFGLGCFTFSLNGAGYISVLFLLTQTSVLYPAAQQTVPVSVSCN